MIRKAKIIFFGTPNFAIPTLKSLINSKYSVLAVVTTPDKPQGRGNKIKYSAVKDFAISSGIKIFQPENLDKKEFYTKITQHFIKKMLIIITIPLAIKT